MHLTVDKTLSLIGSLWVLWLGYWAITGAQAKAAARVESPESRRSHTVPVFIGALCLALGRHPQFGIGLPLPDLALPAVLLVIVGLLFSVWARWHLGRNWSMSVSIKEEHQLIRSGPYRWVRHPIYTGVITALLGTALAISTLPAVVGFGLMVVGFVRKLRIEETWMRGMFGEQYVRYASEVSALIPFIY